MNEPERFQPGELLAASRLNDALDYSRGQYAQVPGVDFEVFGGSNANGRAQKRFERIMLVRAREDFEVRITNCSVEDDIPAGRVDMPRIIPQVNAYEVPTSIRPDWVYDPVAGLSGLPTKREGDYFHVVFNEDSGRWEVLSSPSAETFEAIVGQCLGDGWHEVYIVEWNGRPGDSTSGSASVSDETVDDCDLCGQVAQAGSGSFSGSASASDADTSITCDSMTLTIDRTTGTPTGETVYAHTTRLLPMKTGGLIKIRKRIRSSASDSASTSESVSDDVILDRLYDVVDGVWPVVTMPFPEYECCVDPVTEERTIRLVGCTQVIVEGYSCPAGTDECPVGSESV